MPVGWALRPGTPLPPTASTPSVLLRDSHRQEQRPHHLELEAQHTWALPSENTVLWGMRAGARLCRAIGLPGLGPYAPMKGVPGGRWARVSHAWAPEALPRGLAHPFSAGKGQGSPMCGQWPAACKS